MLNSTHYFSIALAGLAIVTIIYFRPGNTLTLPKKSIIDLETRYVLSPTWKPKPKQLIVNIEIESYQNTQALSIDFDEHILLEDQLNHLYDVKKWEILSENTHRTRAKIWFKLKPTANQVVLRLFGLKNYEFNWNLDLAHAQ